MSKCPCCGSQVELGMVVSLETNTALIDGRSLKLQPRQAEILKVLIEKYPSYASTTELMNKVVGLHCEGSYSSLQVNICALNKHLPSVGYRAVNKYGVGYILSKLERAAA